MTKRLTNKELTDRIQNLKSVAHVVQVCAQQAEDTRGTTDSKGCVRIHKHHWLALLAAISGLSAISRR